MILQALNGYYQRKMSDLDPQGRLPAFGLEDKEVPFVIELSRDGKLLDIKDTRHPEGKKKMAQRFLVPQSVKKTSGIAANLLWDTAEYVLGIDTKGKPERVLQQAQAFRARIAALPESVQSDAGVKAVLSFLDAKPTSVLESSDCWREIKETNPVMSFRLAEDADLVCQRDAVIGALAGEDAGDGSADSKSVCLITGKLTVSERLHAAIKGVWGAQTSGANIVSFNLDAFASYGKEQGDNAPTSQTAAFAYTTALNHLLRKGSRQRLQVGDASTVFWAQEPDEVEDTFASFFGESDNPDRTEAVRAALEAIHAGKFDGARGDRRFFVLGLAPNAARISVRFWLAEPLRDVAHRICEWFDDIQVARAPHDPEYPSLFRLLTACAVQGKADNVPPNLGADVMRAILSGLPYPVSWLNAAVQRSRAERNVSYPRAAAIRACLNRGGRYSSGQKEFKPMLDITNKNAGYRLGRLFSALEKVQQEAHPDINATIRDRYYGAASSTPVAVFTTLLRLKNHHVAKLKPGRASYFERLLGEIMDDIKAFPSHLSLSDQGRFALGYYHQRQGFFVKIDEKSE